MPPAAQRAGAEKRGWRFPMVSADGTSLFKDLGFEADGGPMPGASILHRNADGSLARQVSVPFGPGDKFCSVFNFFELLPEQASD